MQIDFLQFPFLSYEFLQFDCLRFVQFFARVSLDTLIKFIFVVRIHMEIFLIPIFLSLWNYTGTINGNVYIILKYAVLCSGYAACLSDHLWQLTICSRMSWFMAHIYSILDLYIYTISFILIIFVSCVAHACSYNDQSKCLTHSYIQT